MILLGRLKIILNFSNDFASLDRTKEVVQTAFRGISREFKPGR